MKTVIYFIDNILDAIELQKNNLFEEIQGKSERCKINNSTIAIEGSMDIDVSGKKLVINHDTDDSVISDFIQNNIINLFNKYDLVQLVIDCNLDEDDEKKTSRRLINKLIDFSGINIDKLIVTIVSAYYYPQEQKSKIIGALDSKINQKVKFLSRPMGNDTESGKTYWDKELTSNGRYEMANFIFDKYGKDSKYKVIEELLYADTESANYFGAILSRFLKKDKIEELL